ncbi:class I SAM-dependent methyltransferase [archaeon]|nr:class I SAM-dependent methyltransferase [archaeon]
MIEFKTENYGLKFEKKFNSNLDDIDWFNGEHDILHTKIIHEFSDKDKSILLDCIENLKSKNSFNCVLEIGVNRSGEYSSTQFLLKHKPQNTKYVGIDINCALADGIQNIEKNIYGKCCNSSNYDEILNYLNSLNIKEIDLLIIDGWHSINQVFLDFKYAQILSKNGIIFLHDTNYHPGPKNLLECVDDNLFNKHIFFENEEDWGVAFLQKK